MKRILKIYIFCICLFGCSTSNILADENSREIWIMYTAKPIMKLLGLKELPKGNCYIIEYFEVNEKMKVHFLYSDRAYDISVKRKSEIEYVLYTDNGSIDVYKITKKGKYADLIYFIDNLETLKKIKNQKWASYYDGLYDKKIANAELYNNLPAYINKLREQYEFARQEQEYFDKVRKDEEDMKKNK